MEAEEFLKLKILETAIKYRINVDANTLGKYQYYIARDFLGFGKIDGIMRDENIEDVSCDGTNSPVFVWHRKYESIPSNVDSKLIRNWKTLFSNLPTYVADTSPSLNQF